MIRHESAAEAEHAIELVGLGRRFGALYVLADLNLTVAAGRLVVLRGSNGAGKTTLLRVVATRLRPNRGRGAVFGFDLVKEADEVRRRTSYLPVLGGVYPSLTARENLRVSARLSGEGARAEATVLDALLDEVGLYRQRDQMVRTFSSGMKKRLGLARLKLSPAKLWLLDEPHAALDATGRALVDRLLEVARAESTTVVIASHEHVESLASADAVLELDQGMLRIAGPKSEAEPEAAR